MLFCNIFNKKKVTFSNIVTVCLIPNRQIMIDYGIKDLLWWSEKDYIDFKKSLINKNNYF